MPAVYSDIVVKFFRHRLQFDGFDAPPLYNNRHQFVELLNEYGIMRASKPLKWDFVQYFFNGYKLMINLTQKIEAHIFGGVRTRTLSATKKIGIRNQQALIQ